MGCVYNRFIGFMFVLLGVLGLTGIGIYHGRLLGVLGAASSHALLYLALGTLMVVAGFECRRESTGKAITRIFGLFLLLLAMLGYMAYPDPLPGGLRLGPADIVFLAMTAVAGIVAALPYRLLHY